MDDTQIQDLEAVLFMVKWVWPVVSGCFSIIMLLLIYIWKTNTSRTSDILEKINCNLKDTGDTLAKIVTLTAVLESRVNNIDKEKAL